MSFPKYQEYKDSGVAWLGEIPAHWDIWQSKRMFALRNERARPGDEMLTASQKYGVISQSRFMELEGQRVVQVLKGSDILKHVTAGDFVISMRSFQGGIEYSPYDGAVSSAYVALQPSPAIHPGFFRYLFKSAPYISALQATSNLVRDGQALRYDNFVQVPLPYLSLGEQSAIADFLDARTAQLDQLLAEQRALITVLNEKREAEISHMVTKGLNPNVAMKAPGIYERTSVPAHWDSVRIKDVAMVNPPKSEVANLPSDTLVSFVPMEAIGEEGELSLTRAVPIGEVIGGYTYLRDGDVAVAKITPCFENGKGAVMRELHNGIGFGTTELTVLRPSPKVTAQFLYYVLTSRHVRNMGEASMYGAAGQQRVPTQFFKDLVVHIPPLHEQYAINVAIGEIQRDYSTLRMYASRATILLQEYRSALISAAVTGKIDVRAPKASHSSRREIRV